MGVRYDVVQVARWDYCPCQEQPIRYEHIFEKDKRFQSAFMGGFNKGGRDHYQFNDRPEDPFGKKLPAFHFIEQTNVVADVQKSQYGFPVPRFDDSTFMARSVEELLPVAEGMAFNTYNQSINLGGVDIHAMFGLQMMRHFRTSEIQWSRTFDGRFPRNGSIDTVGWHMVRNFWGPHAIRAGIAVYHTEECIGQADAVTSDLGAGRDDIHCYERICMPRRYEQHAAAYARQAAAARAAARAAAMSQASNKAAALRTATSDPATSVLGGKLSAAAGKLSEAKGQFNQADSMRKTIENQIASLQTKAMSSWFNIGSTRTELKSAIEGLKSKLRAQGHQLEKGVEEIQLVTSTLEAAKADAARADAVAANATAEAIGAGRRS